MGNRAVIAAEGAGAHDTAVYLHWNGGPESVRAFLRVASDLGVRSPQGDPAYFFARFAQIVGNFFGGTTSVGAGALSTLDTTGDNGTFYIGQTKEAPSLRVVRDVGGHGDYRDANYEFAVYRDALACNYSIFARDRVDALPKRSALIKRAAIALGIDLKTPCKECGYYNGRHTRGCAVTRDATSAPGQGAQ